MKKLAQFCDTSGYGYTACLDGVPVGAAGIVLHNDGIAEAWALFSPAVKAFPVSLYRSVVAGFAEAREKAGKLETIFSFIDPNDDTAARFIKRCGFVLTKHVYEFKGE
jgi:hypothetical protein